MTESYQLEEAIAQRIAAQPFDLTENHIWIKPLQTDATLQNDRGTFYLNGNRIVDGGTYIGQMDEIVGTILGEQRLQYVAKGRICAVNADQRENHDELMTNFMAQQNTIYWTTNEKLVRPIVGRFITLTSHMPFGEFTLTLGGLADEYNFLFREKQ